MGCAYRRRLNSKEPTKLNCLFGCCTRFVIFGMCLCIKKLAIRKYSCCMSILLLAGQSVRVQRSNNRQRRCLYTNSIDFITISIYILLLHTYILCISVFQCACVYIVKVRICWCKHTENIRRNLDTSIDSL